MFDEEFMRRNDTRWMLKRLPPEQAEFCRNEARRLEGMLLTDEETGNPVPYEEWLYLTTRITYLQNEKHRSRYCGEMEGLA